MLKFNQFVKTFLTTIVAFTISMLAFSQTTQITWGSFVTVPAVDAANSSSYQRDLASDAAGNVFGAGNTQYQTWVGGTVSSGVWDNTHNGALGDWDGYLYKMAADGKNLLWWTYIGGSFNDDIWGVEYSKEGVNEYVYATGFSEGSIAIPGGKLIGGAKPGIVAGGYGSRDAFVAKFDALTGDLVWFRWIGGLKDDCGFVVKVSTNKVHIAGFAGQGLPVVANALKQTLSGDWKYDGFYAKFDFSGNLDYCTYAGFETTVDYNCGIGAAGIRGLDVIGDNDVLMAGVTSITGVNEEQHEFLSGVLPIGAVDNALGNGALGYVMRLKSNKANASDKVFASLIKKKDAAGTYTFASDVKFNKGSIYVLGYTDGVVTGVPNSGVFQTTNKGQADAYVLKLDTLTYSITNATMYGGRYADYATSLNLCTLEPTFSGQTNSDDLPVLDYLTTGGLSSPTRNMNVLQGTQGKNDLFVASINLDFTATTFATYLGGSYDEHPFTSYTLNGKTGGHALNGNNLIVGASSHSFLDMPTTNDAYKTTDATVTIGTPDLDFLVSFPKPGGSCALISNATPDLDLDLDNSSGKTVADYQTTFTEKGAGVNIADISDTKITDADNVTMASGTIVLTNKFAGDYLVLGTLTGITATIDSSVVGKITVTFTGVTNLANYETAINTTLFKNGSNNPNTTDRVINVTVNDGTINSNTAVSTIHITAVNNAPDLDLDADNSSLKTVADYQTNYTENGSGVTIADGDLTITDLDNANLASATIVLTNKFLGDTIKVIGALPAGITALVTKNATSITITLSGSATLASYITAIKQIQFSSTSDDPNTTDRLINVTANDGVANSNPGVATIHFTAVNDAPILDLDANNTTASGNNALKTYIENAAGVQIADIDVSASDADNANLSSAIVELTNWFSGDTIKVEGVLPAGITASTLQVGTKITITLTGPATKADYETALEQIQFSSTSNFSNPTDRIVNFTVNDGTFNSNTAIATIKFPAVNDKAILDLDDNDNSGKLIGDYQTTYTENGIGTTNKGVQITDADIRITDPDNTNLTEAVIVLTNQLAGDTLKVGNLFGGITVKSIVKAGGKLTITLSGTATLVNYDSTIKHIEYSNKLDNASTTDRFVEVTVNDGAVNSDPVTATIHFTAVNDNPILDLDANNSSLKTVADYQTTYIENTSGVNIGDVDDTKITDADGANLTSATIVLTNKQLGDTIKVGALTGITAVTSIGVGTITITLSGNTTLADYENAIKNIQFSSSSNDTSTIDRIINVQVNDGSGANNLSNVAVSTIHFTTVNDAAFIDLDADDNSGKTVADYQTTYIENGLGVTIGDTDTKIKDSDNTTLASAVIILTNKFLGDTIKVGVLPEGINSAITKSGNTFTITLSGLATLENYESAIKNITFSNNGENPDITTRVITVVVNDGNLNSNTATSYIKVVNVNDDPVVKNEYVTTNEDVKIVNSLSTITANDVDIDKEVLTVSLIDNGNHGTLTIVGNTYEYIPVDFYNGKDTVIFNVCDPHVVCRNDTLFITIDPVNSALILDLDSNNTSGKTGNDFQDTFTENDAHLGINITDNDVSIFNPDNIDVLSAKIILINKQIGDSLLVKGALPLGVSASVVYSASDITLTITGAKDSSVYKSILEQIQFNNIRDDISIVDRIINTTVANANGNSNIAITTLHVVNINDDPVTVMTELFTNEDVVIKDKIAILLMNDKDPEGGFITIADVVVTQGSHGVFTVNKLDSTYTYTPNKDYFGPDVVVVSVCDPKGACRNDSIFITVNPINDATVLDLDADNSTKTGADYTTTYVENNTGLSIGDTDVSIVDVDNVTLQSALIKLINTKAGDKLIVAGALPGGITSVSSTSGDSTIITLTGVGTLADYESIIKQIQFSSTLDTLDPTDRFVYVTVNDGLANSNLAITTIKMSNVNDNPITVISNLLTKEDSTITGKNTSILINDKDPEGGVLVITAVTTQALHGVFTINTADSTYRYVPNEDYFGPDTVKVSVCDPQGVCATKTIAITVLPVNDPSVLDLDKDNSSGKIGADYTSTFTEDGAAIHINDQDILITDIDDVQLVSGLVKLINTKYKDSLTIGTMPAGLTAKITHKGDTTIVSISGTAAKANYETAINQIEFWNTSQNPDTTTRFIAVSVNDGKVNSNVAVTTIHVTNTNDDPVVVNDKITIDEDEVVTNKLTTISANDSDPDGDSLTTTLLTNALHGNITFTDSTYTYNPNGNYYGKDTVVFSVCDPHNACKKDTLFITINPINDALVVINNTVNIYNNSKGEVIDFLSNDSDIETKVYSTGNVLPGGHGAITNINLTTGTFTYTPLDVYFVGIDTVIYNVCDQGYPLPATCKEDTIFVVINEHNTHCTDLDLDKDNSSGQYSGNFGVEFVENSGPIKIADTDLYIFDQDDKEIVSAQVTLTNTLPGDSLYYEGGTYPNVTTTVVKSNGNWVIDFKGVSDTDNYKSLLLNVKFVNSKDNLSGEMRDVLVTVNDGICTSSSHAYIYAKQVYDATHIENEVLVIREDSVWTTGFHYVLHNDFSKDGDSLVIDKLTIVNAGSHGTFVFNADTTFTYSPKKDFNGTDLVVIRVCDTKYCYNDTISIVITPVADPIVVNNEYFSIKKGPIPLSNTTTNITLNDSNVDGGILSVHTNTAGVLYNDSLRSDTTIVGTLGTLTISKNGVFSYQCNTDHASGGLGDDVFIFDVCAGGICLKDTLTITVYGVPTGFSPNGDGKNDHYAIVYPLEWGNATIQVYNRWGSLVYEMENYLDQWDGTSNRGITIGNDLPDGTYFVDIKFAQQANENHVYSITLLR